METTDRLSSADDKMLQIQREVGKLDGQIVEVQREYTSFRKDLMLGFMHQSQLILGRSGREFSKNFWLIFNSLKKI